MVKPGIEPANPGLQGIALHHGGFSLYQTFCGFSMGRNQYWAGRVYDLCVYYMTGKHLTDKWYIIFYIAMIFSNIYELTDMTPFILISLKFLFFHIDKHSI